jgi:hypothetical protein
LAAEVVTLEKEYGYGITGESQLDLTPFQKQVLLKEHKRQQEQAQQKQGKASPSGALNARNPKTEGGYTQEYHYSNDQEFETKNQVEFVD